MFRVIDTDHRDIFPSLRFETQEHALAVIRGVFPEDWDTLIIIKTGKAIR